MMFRRKHELVEAKKYEGGVRFGTAIESGDRYDGAYYAIDRGDVVELQHAEDFEREHEPAPNVGGSYEGEEEYED